MTAHTTQKICPMSRRTMLKSTGITGAALLLAPTTLCAAPKKHTMTHNQTRILLGTFVSISAIHESTALAEDAMAKAFIKAQNLETILSRHTPSSAMTELNTHGKILKAPTSLMHVLQRAKRMHALTQGAFDMTITPILELYKKHKNAQGTMHLDPKSLAHAQELVLASEVHLNEHAVRLGRSGMSLTLDGIAKGYIADQMAHELQAMGIHNYLVNAGGDIRTAGQKGSNAPWRIGIEHPLTQNAVVTNLPLNGAIATSGCYEMYFDAQKKYHHLINPAMRTSPQHTLSVSVTAPTALEADALATALSVLPTRDALTLIHSLPGKECCILTSQGRMITSHGWNVTG